MPTRRVTGIHHVTAIASDPQRNLDFYTRVLGLRLVKLTVNFDDPGTYHLYFGNGEGTPGSILTFFPWPGAYQGTVGSGQVAASAFAAQTESADYWTARLGEHGISAERAGQRFGEPVIRFPDPDGLPLEIVATSRDHPEVAWQGGPVPGAHALRGFHSATLNEADHPATAATLAVMGFSLAGHEGNRFRYQVGEGAAGILDVLHEPTARHGRLGAGTVHHIAFRTPDDGEQRAWREDLSGRGYDVTPIADRMYFRSIYFREPGGVLFEVATDPPGFATDEVREHLGERLMLPEWLEPERALLERRLPRLTRGEASAVRPNG